jgi:mono/diheme cytochrome c family protein
MTKVLRAVAGRFGLLVVVGVGCLCASVAQLHSAESQAVGSQTPATSPASVTSPQRALLNQYCVTCHNERLHTAGLMLDKMDLGEVATGAEAWEKVLVKLRTGAMPPPSMPRPDKATIDGFAGWLETGLDQAAAARPNPGRVAIHRLNRTEYANAIRDLLALEIDPRSVLTDEDPGESGFDNTAGALPVSTLLVEKYLLAARRVSRLAVGDPTTAAAFDTYTISKMLVQDDRTSEDLPFASRGGIAVRHRFVVDGEYVVKIRLTVQLYDYIQGLGRPHPLEVRVDGERIKRFIVGGDAPGKPAPDSFAGDIRSDPEWERYMHEADKGLEVRFPARAGTHIVGVTFAEAPLEPEGVRQPPQYQGGTGASGGEKNQRYYGNPGIATVAIGGPYSPGDSGETPSRQRIFVCRPKTAAEEPACARQILSTLARRAFRRPATEQDVQQLLGFYNAGRKQARFDSGIQVALTRLLVSPEFLVRIERDPANVAPGTAYRLDDLALASRLSFFLWSSIPDDELLDVAARGRLRDPRILEQQVRRMLVDERSKALINNFANQWLTLPKLRGVAPDPDLFPDFDQNLRDGFQQETLLFMDSQIRADRSVTDLIGANYTFVNERLARFYQIPNIYGAGFRRVTFDDGVRGGLLGQGSILTVTSYANRTSPVLRGKWLLQNILGTPPPPPPPNVPTLAESTRTHPVSVRERLEEHRKNPVCSSCHSRMDPLGFALENFDAVGRWRDVSEGGTRVDSTSALPDGTQMNGVAGLRSYLLGRPQQFAGAVAEKLLQYAVGRSTEYYDLPAIRKITREAAGGQYRWSAIISGIVKSVPFQMNIAGDNSVSVASDSPLGAATAAK